MEYAQKMRVLEYFQGEACRCGAPKKPRRWTCKPCKAIQSPELGAELDKACDAHIAAGMKFVEDCLSRRGICPTSSL